MTAEEAMEPGELHERMMRQYQGGNVIRSIVMGAVTAFLLGLVMNRNPQISPQLQQWKDRGHTFRFDNQFDVFYLGIY